MTNFSETTEAEIEVVSNSEEIYTALLTPPGESEDHYQELKPTGKTLRIKAFKTGGVVGMGSIGSAEPSIFQK